MPTVTPVTPLAERAKSAPHYGGIVPPINYLTAELRGIKTASAVVSELFYNHPVCLVTEHIHLHNKNN
jgi:hypothetical protein